MSDKIDIKNIEGVRLDLDSMVVNTDNSADVTITTADHVNSWNTNILPGYTESIDHSEEIAELKKEIKALKDMIAEHILLGHQE
jgi:hypothetical protein